MAKENPRSPEASRYNYLEQAFYTRTQAAKILATSKRTIDLKRDKGLLETVDDDGRKKIPRESLIAEIERLNGQRAKRN